MGNAGMSKELEAYIVYFKILSSVEYYNFDVFILMRWEMRPIVSVRLPVTFYLYTLAIHLDQYRSILI